MAKQQADPIIDVLNQMEGKRTFEVFLAENPARKDAILNALNRGVPMTTIVNELRVNGYALTKETLQAWHRRMTSSTG
jgi:hypothetical protein